ncbi:B-cell scaffold protein with ankyrin repeats isoform X4 [Dromaius novaehollandiae]|uniref:B-cell scaffold protein with ankyrin repeats isoform X4 n=1 Tax=Dromaius novaehollandiae TaxID=8790 RepID=UPI00311F8070
MRPAEHTKDILVIYEQEAEEWALYLKTLFRHILNEEGILLYSLKTSSVKHLELFSLSRYKCKLLILSCGLLKSLNQKRGHFLEQVLKPPDNVVILLCGVENSDVLYDLLTLDGGSKEISTDQEPEEYLSIVTGIIQSGKPQDKNLEDSLSYVYEADDYQNNTDVNLSNIRGASEEADLFLDTEVVSETLETNRRSALVLPARISCENPGEIFILLKDEIDDETLEIEFIANNQRIRTQPASWNQKVKYMKALDFPAGPVYVNVCCGGVIKATAQIEYYTALGEIENILKKVADPIAFACQTFEFSSVEKLDNVLTLLLKSKMSAYEFSTFQSEEQHHQQANSHLEELPTLLHCAAKFGLKNLAALLLRCPMATQACNITNKDGDNPAGIAGKHGHRELQKLIRDFLINAADNFTSYEEEVEEDDTYVLMLGSETQPAIKGNLMEDRSEREHGDGDLTACYREDQDACEGDEEEEDPYTFAKLDESLYDLILADKEEEKRKERRSFIVNRPPAPAPRPICSPVREENTPYIVQVFQQKATRMPSVHDKMCCDVRKQAAHRGHTDTATYSTLKHTIPAEQEALIHLQEQVKKGAISVDEALEKFKQWQKEKSRPQSAQQEKVRHLRENNVGNRLEKENLNVHKESRPESIHFRDLLYYTPFNKVSPIRNPTDKEQMPN